MTSVPTGRVSANDKRMLSDHFALAEFASHDGAGFPEEALVNLVGLANVLEKIRTHFGGKPVRVLSGYRSPAHNKAVGGAERSQHMLGKAADIAISGVTPKQVADFACTLPEVGGCSAYDAFTHVDTRQRVNGQVVTWGA